MWVLVMPESLWIMQGDTPNNEETGNKETNGEALTEENASVKADSKEEFEEDKVET